MLQTMVEQNFLPLALAKCKRRQCAAYLKAKEGMTNESSTKQSN
jgi:hypothetical protein